MCEHCACVHMHVVLIDSNGTENTEAETVTPVFVEGPGAIDIHTHKHVELIQDKHFTIKSISKHTILLDTYNCSIVKYPRY